MSKSPILYLENVRMEQCTIIPDPEANPYGLRLPVYATAPDPEANVPGTVIFNSTTNAMQVVRNDGTYLPLSFDGAADNVVLATYDTDGEAPDVQGSIYLNNDAFPNTIRYRNGGTFMSVISANGGAVNVFNNPIINLTPASDTGQAVEYDQFLAGPFLANTSTLDEISNSNPTAGDVKLNNNKITGLTAGNIAGDAVEYNQLVTAPFWGNTARLNDIAAANPTSANISMSGHKITGVTAGAAPGEAVEFSQLGGFYANTVPLQSITLATADLNLNTHKITGLVAGAATGQAVEYDQLVAAVGVRASYSMWLTTPASTTIALAGTMYKLAGTFAYGTAANFGNGSTDNRFVYTGSTTAMMQMAVSATLSHDALATTTNIRVAIMKNGVTLLGSSSSALQAGATVLLNVPVSISTVGQTSMATNDYLEIFVTTDAIVGTTTVTPVAVLATISAV